MELERKRIHMVREKNQTTLQFPLEEDLNIPDAKPDVNAINLEKGEVVVEQIRPGTEQVVVKGRFWYALLYDTKEEGCKLVKLEGGIPFEEKVNLPGCLPTDHVEVKGEVEDFTVTAINSRKLNLQSLLSLKLSTRELYDEELPIAVLLQEKKEGQKTEELLELQRRKKNIAQLTICKNDVFRWKEEAVLPASYPNISQILWDSISFCDVEWKAMEEKIGISGEVRMFLLYEGEGENHPIRSFETSFPFNGSLECHGCREQMLADIGYRLGQKELTIRPDLDGEERCIGVEAVLELAVRIYEEEECSVLTDLYGVTREMKTKKKALETYQLLSRVTGKMKLAQKVKLQTGGTLQLLHSEGCVYLERQQNVENGIEVQGGLSVKIMGITGDDVTPFGVTKIQIPYQYTLDIPGIREHDKGNVCVELEQLQVFLADGEEMDVKAILAFHTVVFHKETEEMITEAEEEEKESDRKKNLPGMVIYIVREGDTLWEIGKKYFMTQDSIRELNQLESEELKTGQKLFLMKNEGKL